MKKILPAIIAVLLIILAVAHTRSNSLPQPNTVDDFKVVDIEEIDRSQLIPAISNIKLPKLSFSVLESQGADRAWEVFLAYIESAKEHNLANLRKVSYQISEACNDPDQETECFARMDNVVAIGEGFKREDFKNIWSDSKQIIMSTDYDIQEDTNGSPIRGIVRSIIYFVIDESGNPRVLTFNNFDGTFILVENEAREEADEKLVSLVIDSDLDGLPDRVETCDNDTPCESLDPNKRDANGNGWWDSTESFFYENRN